MGTASKGKYGPTFHNGNAVTIFRNDNVNGVIQIDANNLSTN